MQFRLSGNGHGDAPGKVAVTELSKECSLFHPFEEKPPPVDLLAVSLADVFIKWMQGRKVTVRHALPIVKDGNTTYIFVWHDPLEG
jgi:hypothetical protein